MTETAPPPAPIPHAAATGAGPLAPAQLAAIEAGRHATRRIRRAAVVAHVSGGTLGLCALLTALGVVLGNVVALALGLSLGVIAAAEIRGGTALRRFDPSAPRLLALNQLALAVVLVGYAGWRLAAAALATDAELLGGSSTGDPGMDATIAGLRRTIGMGVYATLLVVGLIAPLLMARYYQTRSRHLRAAIAEVPEWVRETLRRAA